MMRAPEPEVFQDWVAHVYDPAKAHTYYDAHKKLKGRRRGSGDPPPSGSGVAKTNAPPRNSARAAQKKELSSRIQLLSVKLVLLDSLIQKRENDTPSGDPKAKAKKERAAKEKNKPKELKHEVKAASSKSGDSSEKKTADSKLSVSELKNLATKVRGQIAVAKQKLAAL